MDLGARRTERSPRIRLLPVLSVQPPPPSPRRPRARGCAAVRKGARVSGHGVRVRGGRRKVQGVPETRGREQSSQCDVQVFSFLAAEPPFPAAQYVGLRRAGLRDLAQLCSSRGKLSGVSSSDISMQRSGTRMHLPPSSCPPRQACSQDLRRAALVALALLSPRDPAAVGEHVFLEALPLAFLFLPLPGQHGDCSLPGGPQRLTQGLSL